MLARVWEGEGQGKSVHERAGERDRGDRDIGGPVWAWSASLKGAKASRTLLWAEDTGPWAATQIPETSWVQPG